MTQAFNPDHAAVSPEAIRQVSVPSGSPGDRHRPLREEPTPMNDDWCQKLQDLMQQACAAPPKSAARRKLSDQLIRHLQSKNIPYSPSYDRIAQAGTSGSRKQQLFHQEAANKTWLHFLLNLCECQTKNTQSPYVDNTCEHVKGRLCTYYNKRLDDLEEQDRKERNRQFTMPAGDEDDRSLEDILAAPADTPDLIQELRQWLQADASGVLRQTHLRDKPAINVQVVLLRRFCDDLPWADITAEFGVPQGTVYQFFRDRCLPLLQLFLAEQGYIDTTPPLAMNPENPNLPMDLAQWLETDPTGVLQSTQLKKCADITAQLVLLREFQSQDKLKDVIAAIAIEHDVKPERLKAFYYRHCKPLLIEFGQRHGSVEQ